MEQRSEARRERLVRRLRTIYEALGYTRYSMRHFEEYALYLENKSFLKSERVLTFTNPDGKLMALKPDVTLSIVKHARQERLGVDKYYYQESVYRLAPTANEFTEIEQMGVEVMGEIDGYAVSEVLRLAIESLAAAENDYVLDISHMGFAAGLMNAAGLDAEQQERLFTYIRQKNAHELTQAVAREGVDTPYAQSIAALAGLSGSFPETLDRAEKLVACEEMAQALSELRTLYAQLTALGLQDHLRLDFSMLNAQDYYNGLVFQGYVEGAPRAVLSGGRYDHLMRRFGKAGDGFGFALYLDELTHVLADKRMWDADVLALYRETDDPAKINAAVFALAETGQRVLAAVRRPADFHAAKTMLFDGETFREVPEDA